MSSLPYKTGPASGENAYTTAVYILFKQQVLSAAGGINTTAMHVHVYTASSITTTATCNFEFLLQIGNC